MKPITTIIDPPPLPLPPSLPPSLLQPTLSTTNPKLKMSTHDHSDPTVPTPSFPVEMKRYASQGNLVLETIDGEPIVIAETYGEQATQNAEKIASALELWQKQCQTIALSAFSMGGF